MDMSPAQPNTPCISKESMSVWMEHIHMQNPIPANVTGVPVSIDAIDPNGNYIHIADVTSDMSGTYSFLWTPDIAGKYTVTATFMGDDSYGSSYAETAVGVVQASTGNSDNNNTPITMPPFEMYFAASTIAIIVAIVIVSFSLQKTTIKISLAQAKLTPFFIFLFVRNNLGVE